MKAIWCSMRMNPSLQIPSLLIPCLLALGLGACNEPGTDGARSGLTAPANQRVDGSLPLASRTSQQKTSPAGKVSTPFNLGEVMRRVHFAIRPAGSAFEGGHSTHDLQISGDLKLKFTPVHHPGAAVARAPAAVAHPNHSRHPDLRRPAPLVGEPLSIHTVDVRRGTRRLATGRGSARVEDDGSLTLDRGAVKERLQNTSAGVEQSWSLASKPDGAGDLVVRVRVTGHRYSGASAGGLHFVDPRTGLGVRYGWATFIDHNGKRTAVRGRFLGGHVVLRVPAAVVQSASYPAVLDPVISSEFGMDQPVHGIAWASQTRPSVAFDGTNYMVVWYDKRDTKTNKWDIYGTRVSALGVVQDKSGIAISTASGDQVVPRLAYHNNAYMVVWHDYRNNSTYPDIYGARVSSAGKLLDPKGIAISTASSYQYHPEVAYGGGNFFVVWYDYRHSKYADIYGARVSAAGVVQDKSGIAISRASHHQVVPQLDYDGTNFLIAWYDYRYNASYPDIVAARVSGAGVLVDKSGFVISKASYYQYNPSVAYNAKSGNYFVAWQDYRSWTKYYWDIYGARVSKAGKVLDTAGIPIAALGNNQYSPRVATDGTDFFVVWHDYRNQSTTGYDIYGARISAAGVVQDKSGIPISSATGTQSSATVAYGGSSYFVVWTDDRNATNIRSDIYGARVFPTGTVLNKTGIQLSTAPNSQSTPAAAFDGTNYLVVWADTRSVKNTSWDIYGVIVSPTGSLVTKSGLAISTATKDQTNPSVSYGGGKYLVVWEDYRGSYRDIYGSQVSTTGQVLQPVGFPVCNATYDQRYPALAYDGANFLVAWQDYRNSTSYSDIYGTRVNTYGGVISTSGFAISKTKYTQAVPSVAYGVGSYLVVWEDNRTSTSNYDIYGTRVTTVGTVVDTKGIAISTNTQHQRNPSVGHDGTNFLVAWEDYRDYKNTSWDIYGARISSAGNVMDSTPVAIATPASSQLRPQVSGYNGDFLVVWEDYRNGAYNPDVYGAEITGGKVQQALGVPISTDKTAHEVTPTLASAGSGGHMVVYALSQPQTTLGTFRVRARTITAKTKNGGACTTGSTCKSGVCADGVCCDKPCGGSATDCQACSASAGAAKDGACGPVKAGAVCRALAGVCDTAESCDGTSLTCPADVLKSSGATCRGALGPCDVAESCDGTSASCPKDILAAGGTMCRAATGPCDEAAVCTGAVAACPANVFKASTAVCRASAGECDAAELCSGTAATCPKDVDKADGVSCTKGQCKSGKCLAVDMGPKDMGPDTTTPDMKVPDQSLPDMGPDKSLPDVKTEPDKTLPPDKSTADQCPTCRWGDCKVVVEEKSGCSVGGGAPTGSALTLGLLLLLFGWRRRRI